MSKDTQVSAYISQETKIAMEAYVKSHGVKKAHLIEQALQHHLQALRNLPEDVIIPSRLVLTEQSIQRVAEQLENTAPTDALKALMRD